MDLPERREETCTAHEAARVVGISKNTLLRWLRKGKVPEVARDRNGWRIFSPQDIETITAFARKTTPPATANPDAGGFRGAAEDRPASGLLRAAGASAEQAGHSDVARQRERAEEAA